MPSTDYPSFVGAPQENTLGIAINKIAQALVDGKAQFLFGAGMSRDSGLPLGAELAKILLEEFFPEAGGGDVPSDDRLEALAVEYPFEAIAHAVEQSPGCKRDDLTEALRKRLVAPNPKPNKAHEVFLTLLGAHPRVKAIFTTNYDTLFETLLGSDLAVAVTDKNATKIDQIRSGGKIPIVYLRGKLDGNDYRITEPEIVSEQYQILMDDFKSALHHADAFVFVGYSLNDMDFRRFYFTFQEQLKARKISGKTTYFVSPPKDKYSYILGTAIWELRQAIWIPLNAHDFFSKLKEVVESRTLAAIRKEVKQVYKVNDAGLTDLIDRTAETWRLTKQDALILLYDNRTFFGGRT